jgi:hypothetical protein
MYLFLLIFFWEYIIRNIHGTFTQLTAAYTFFNILTKYYLASRSGASGEDLQSLWLQLQDYHSDQRSGC